MWPRTCSFGPLATVLILILIVTKEAAHHIVMPSMNYIHESISLALNESERTNTRKEALKQRQNIIGAWKRQLTKRKMLYWQSQLWKHVNYLRNMAQQQQKKYYPHKISHEIRPKWRRRRKESSTTFRHQSKLKYTYAAITCNTWESIKKCWTF